MQMSDTKDDETRKIDIIWRIQSLVAMQKFSFIITDIGDSPFWRDVHAPIYALKTTLNSDVYTSINYLTNEGTTASLQCFGTLNATQKPHVAMGIAIRRSVKRYAKENGKRIVALGSELESVLEFFSDDATLIGNYSIETPLKAPISDHRNARDFNQTIDEITSMLRNTVGIETTWIKNALKPHRIRLPGIPILTQGSDVLVMDNDLPYTFKGRPIIYGSAVEIRDIDAIDSLYNSNNIVALVDGARVEDLVPFLPLPSGNIGLHAKSGVFEGESFDDSRNKDLQIATIGKWILMKQINELEDAHKRSLGSRRNSGVRYTRRDLQTLSVPYGKKFLLSKRILQSNMFDLPPQSSNVIVMALFAPSNTMNERDDWRKLERHSNYVITLPYRSVFDEEIWTGEYSDYTYTPAELSPFMQTSSFIGAINDRADLTNGFDASHESSFKWVVKQNLFAYPDVQALHFNQTHYAKTLGILLREELQMSNETLHVYRKFICAYYRFDTFTNSAITAFDESGTDIEVAGHLINLLLVSRAVPVDVLSYVKVILRNLSKQFSQERLLYEPYTQKNVWHSPLEWKLATEAYVLLSDNTGVPVDFDLVMAVRRNLGVDKTCGL
jgi:hypothetical protein